MTEPSGAMPAAPSIPATGSEANEDALAQNLLADAVAATATAEPQLGDAGKRAIQAERDARKALEKQLAELAPLSKLAAALGGGDPVKGKTELETLSERQATLEKELAGERSARWKEQVAHSKGFTPEQAELLTGSTREELVASADKLLALFPTAPAKPGIPAPDPSQGARGGVGIDLDARIAEAQKAGDIRRVISLQNEKLSNAK